MGLSETTPVDIVDNLSFVPYETSLDGAIQKAYEKRADLQSLKTRIKAAEASIELAKKDYYPVVSAKANYELAGTRFPLNDGWSAGMTVTLPIFSGFLTKYQVVESRENLKVLRSNEESLKLGILFDIQQAYLSLRDAESSISTAEIGVKQATENLDLARGRYSVGVGSPIEVTDAVVAYANARTSYIQALYNYKISQASLEKAMGER
jgi:outer membrane protein TolC